MECRYCGGADLSRETRHSRLTLCGIPIWKDYHHARCRDCSRGSYIDPVDESDIPLRANAVSVLACVGSVAVSPDLLLPTTALAMIGTRRSRWIAVPTIAMVFSVIITAGICWTLLSGAMP